MFTNTKIALATAVILASACAAWANDSGENHQDEDRATVSGSVAAVNPWIGKSTDAGGAYGYTGAQSHKQRPVRQQTESR